MPQTKKGKLLLKKFKQEYGPDKGERIYYASIVSGRVKGAEGKGGTGKLEKAKRTYAKRHKKGKKKK